MRGNYFKKIRSKRLSRIKIDILQGDIFTTLSEVFETFVDIIQILQWQTIQPFGNLGISISASASALTSAAASALQNFFFLRSFYFCLSKILMKKKSMVKSFSSALAHLPGSCSRCLQQLFCRKPVSTCF